MKLKRILLILALVTLTACNGNAKNNENSGGISEDTAKDEVVVAETENVSEKGVFEVKNFIMKINSHEFIKSKFDDSDIIAFNVTYTNKAENAESPYMDFAMLLPHQKTDTTLEILNGANGEFPDDYYPDLVKMGETKVLTDATVDAIVGFKLLYKDAPVVFEAIEKPFDYVIEVDLD